MSLPDLSDSKTINALPLTSPKRVRALLAHYNLHADKRFGQNFLIDTGVLEAIVKSANLASTDTVFEVGPGLGVLTYELAQRVANVITVELDSRILPVLEHTLAEFDNVNILHADALKVDLTDLPDPTVMVANLPYNIATPLLRNVLASGRFTRIICLIQKEVAERLAAKPSTPAYGALSLWTQYYADVTVLRNVKPSSFWPPPKVTSAIVQLKIDRARQPAPALFKVIEHAFQHRRKTLKKNLLMAGYADTRVQDVLEKLELNPKVRAEALPLATFEQLVALLE
ncbi:MAG: 16S rRNA (adenine(1518)-N(6)/adenine(1519)-N(6))-dimethyltransferase RsmA [Deinococcota bacterium]